MFVLIRRLVMQPQPFAITGDMAQAAKEMFKSSQLELEEAMRQARRYLDSHKPSTRIINQRIQRIRDKEDEFKRYHLRATGN